MSCDPVLARAGDALPLLFEYRLPPAQGQSPDEGEPVPLTGLQSRAEFRTKDNAAVLLTLTEGAGLTTAGPDGAHTIALLATATQTLALAPPSGALRWDVNLAIRVFDPLDVAGTSRTIADATVTVRALEVSAP
jgi:hypothetical protein